MNTQCLLVGKSFDRKLAMQKIRLIQWFRWVFMITFGLWAILSHGEEFRYRYVSFTDKAPPGYDFFLPSGINDSGLVSGTAIKCNDALCFDFTAAVAIYKNGAVTVLQTGSAGPINAGGTIGGSVVVSPDPNFMEQAALFRKNKVELIPPQTGEFLAFVIALNDSGTALVYSIDDSFNEAFVLYKKGQANVINFGPTITNPRLSFNGGVINNQGVIAGTTGDPFIDDRAFRFSPRNGKVVLLDPMSPDTLA